MLDRTFSDEVLRRLAQLDADRFEEKFRAAWSRMAKHQGVAEQLPIHTDSRTLWRMAFSQALAESVDPEFNPTNVAGSREERAAVMAAHHEGVRK